MNEPDVLPELPERVAARLVGGQAHVVATVDASGLPSTTLMTWVVARGRRQLALCVDTRSRAFRNLLECTRVAIEILDDELVWCVRGEARIAKEQMEATPFPCALVEVDILDAKDHAAPGTSFQGPRYRYAEDKQHRLDFEARIFEELRGG